MSGSIAFEALPPRARDRLVLAVAGALCTSPWRRRRDWHRVVACIEDAPSLEPRHALAERLRAAGLADFAHEVLVRKVLPDHVLVYAVFDRPELAGHGLWTLPLVAEL